MSIKQPNDHIYCENNEETYWAIPKMSCVSVGSFSGLLEKWGRSLYRGVLNWALLG